MDADRRRARRAITRRGIGQGRSNQPALAGGDGDRPVEFDPVAAGAPVAQALPNASSMQLSTRINLSAGKASYITGTFDNFRIGSGTLVIP